VVTCGAIPPVAAAVRREGAAARPWHVLLVAMVLLNVANVAMVLRVDGNNDPTAGGPIVDLLLSVGHVTLLTAAIIVVLRRGRNDLGGVIDATVVALSFGGVAWTALILPRLATSHASTSRQMALFIDVFVLLGVLGALGRVWLAAHEPIPALRYLVVALLGALVGNVAAALASDPVTGARPDWTNMTFLHPTRPGTTR
jgi:diguanylate cyclase